MSGSSALADIVCTWLHPLQLARSARRSTWYVASALVPKPATSRPLRPRAHPGAPVPTAA